MAIAVWWRFPYVGLGFFFDPELDVQSRRRRSDQNVGEMSIKRFLSFPSHIFSSPPSNSVRTLDHFPVIQLGGVFPPLFIIFPPPSSGVSPYFVHHIRIMFTSKRASGLSNEELVSNLKRDKALQSDLVESGMCAIDRQNYVFTNDKKVFVELYAKNRAFFAEDDSSGESKSSGVASSSSNPQQNPRPPATTSDSFSSRIGSAPAASTPAPRPAAIPASVPQRHLDIMAYRDRPQPLGWSATISAPHMHAKMLTTLFNTPCGDGGKAGTLEQKLRACVRSGAPGRSFRILDVGCGSGYLTAVFAAIVRNVCCCSTSPQQSQSEKNVLAKSFFVVGLDYVPELVNLARGNIGKRDRHLLDEGWIKELAVGDGWLGYEKHAPYDIIHVGAGAKRMPEDLVNQLKPGGLMLVPLDSGFLGQDLTLVMAEEEGGAVKCRGMGSVVFVPLVETPYGAASG